MSDVRVHFESALPAQVGAQAFAYGKNIFIEPGAENALAHEAWHVVQQKQGRVPQTALVNGIMVNDDPSLEVEADVMGPASERLGRYASDDQPRAMIARRQEMRPVVQRLMTVGESLELPVTTPTPAEARHQLNLLYRMTTANTPYLQAIIDDMSNADLDFANWAAVKKEVKRRSFGYRHVEAMEALRQLQETARTNFMRTQNYDESKLKTIIEKFQGATSRSLGALNTKYGTLNFIIWTQSSAPLKAQATSIIRSAPFYAWYTNAANSDNPGRMNCWECVLYSGAWTNGGARVPLYGRDYALWALRDRQLPKDSGLMGAGEQDAPFFVYDLVNNPVYQSVATDDRINRVPVIPERIPAGMIITFNYAEHVALVTGRMKANSKDLARALYGDQGHEILELDGKTYWMVRSTVEDTIAVGYNNRIHLGWLPEIVNAEQIRLVTPVNPRTLYQVNAQPTAFYT